MTMAKSARRMMDHVTSLSLAQSKSGAREVQESPLIQQELRRLCAADQRVCQLLLDSLIEAKFLFKNADGRYSRALQGEQRAALPEKLAGSARARAHNRPQTLQSRGTTASDRQSEDDEERLVLMQQIVEMRSTLAEIIKTFS